uniref:Uncharacterized protein n=1 Tax=Ananas comosus var. bracteatus TaxID=296719 RepID=A0A6V7Q6Y9_ANACO|nr:unnamed protein product [Ananas comosus var. bracteatus]
MSSHSLSSPHLHALRPPPLRRRPHIGAVFAFSSPRPPLPLPPSAPNLSRLIHRNPEPAIVTDPSVCEAVGELLTKPEPELAQRIAAECSGDNWEGIVRRV